MVTDMSFKVIIVKSKHTNGAKPVCPKTMGSFCVSIIFVSKISPPNLSKYLNEISTSKTFSFGCGLKVKYFFYILPDQWMFIYRWTDWNMNSNYYICCTIYLWWSMPLLYQTWHSKKINYMMNFTVVNILSLYHPPFNKTNTFVVGRFSQ